MAVFYLLSSWLEGVRNFFARYTCFETMGGLQKGFRIFITFNLVAFGWIFFRADSISDAFYVVTHLTSGLGDFFSNLTQLGKGKSIIGGDLGLSKPDMLMAILLTLMLLAVEVLQSVVNIRKAIGKCPLFLRWSLYYTFIFGTLLLGKYGIQEFIYFQF